MELRTKEILTNERGRIILDQFVLDEDVNVPDSKRDMKRIIASEARLRIEEVKPVENYVKVTGKVEYQVLYVGEGIEAVICSLEGKLPFEEMVYIEEKDGNFDVKLVRVDANAYMIHSRKLRLKAIVELEVKHQREMVEEIPLDIEETEKLYKKKQETEILLLHSKKKDMYRIKEEITLPGTKENIGSMLWSDISNRKLDTKLEVDDFVLSGELLVFCFYESPDGKLDWIEQAVPYQGRITCRGVDETMYHQVQAELEEAHVDVRMDEDGEMRVIGVEGTMRLILTIYYEEKVELLEDVYSLEKQCKLETKETSFETLLLQNHSKCKVSQRLSLPELKNTVLQICHSSGSIQLDRMEQSDVGIRLEGVLHISFLYVKANDEIPFECWSGVVPFSHIIECREGKGEIHTEITSMLEQLSVTLLGGNEVEVKAVLAFHGFLKESEKKSIITNVRMEPISLEEIEKRPGVIGYIVKESDDLWSLAKRYHTTKEGIVEVNEMTGETLKVGDRILIFKESLSIL